jgi:DNA-binding GntR family transcriptional regulator
MGATPQHDRVYAALKEALIEGRIPPGQAVTVASLADMLAAGTMPMREAVRRILAEGGLSSSETRRLTVPALGRERFVALTQARGFLEPEAAVEALPYVTREILVQLRQHDEALNEAIERRDVAGYMRFNYRFHFGLYRATPGSVLCPLIESLWLQFGAYMHLMLDHAPARLLADRHEEALGAMESGNADALRAAIAADIDDALGTLDAAYASGYRASAS